MKKCLFKIATVSTVLVIGACLSLNTASKINPIYAAQHIDNYSEATSYSGHYYDSLSGDYTEGLQGTLRKALSTLIFPKDWYEYSGSSTGTLGKILQSADEDPTNSSNMVLFYTRDSVTKQASSNDGWNREHVWPQSLSKNSSGVQHWGKTKAGADLLHIRPTYAKTNSARDNSRYGDNNKTGVQKYNGMDFAYTSGGYFEPLDSVKGDVARILMYIWTAYYDYYNDPELLVTKAIQSYDVLLKWHTMDAPDELEASRNDFSEGSIQENRNPFVDHPEYGWQIFGDSASESVKQACKEAYPAQSSGQGGGSSSSNPGSSSGEQNTSGNIGSSEESSSIQPSSNNNEQKTDNAHAGCSGSVIGVTSTLGITSVIGLVFIFSKKKQD